MIDLSIEFLYIVSTITFVLGMALFFTLDDEQDNDEEDK